MLLSSHPASFLWAWVSRITHVRNFLTSSGAVAELFDISCYISCYIDTPLFFSLSSATVAFWSAFPSLDTFNITSLISTFNNPLYLGGNPDLVINGQHYFVVNPINNSTISPMFDFNSGRLDGVDGGKGKKANMVAEVVGT